MQQVGGLHLRHLASIGTNSRLSACIYPSLSHSLQLSNGYLIVEAIDYSVFSCLLSYRKQRLPITQAISLLTYIPQNVLQHKVEL